MEEYPLCCFENQFERGCTSAQLSTFATKVLRESVRITEEVFSLCAMDMFDHGGDLHALNAEDQEDLKVSTYLLRHDFWTWMQATTELTAEEKRYFFGHTIFDGKTDLRPLYNNEDILWDLLLKLDHTIKFLPLHKTRISGFLRPGSELSAPNKGIYTLHLSTELLREGGHVFIVLQANEYDDPINLKCLTPTRNVFRQEELKLR